MESRNRSRAAAGTRDAEVEPKSEAEDDSGVHQANVDSKAVASRWQPEGFGEALHSKVTVIAAMAWLGGVMHRGSQYERTLRLSLDDNRRRVAHRWHARAGRRCIERAEVGRVREKR